MGDREAERAVPLTDVLKTGALAERPSRPPDYEGEARALAALVDQLARDPRRLLQAVVDAAITLCRADSTGISIAESEDGRQIFRWHAISGAFAHNALGTLPRDASPCGVVVDRNSSLLFDRPQRHFVDLRGVEPVIHETVLVPWATGDRPIGTLWALAHSPDRHFDAEDARLLASLARFAVAAWQTVQAEERRTALFTQLLTVQEEERKRIAREIHDDIGQQITALRMALETLQVQTNREAALATHAERASRLARELDESIDFLTWDLRPPSLDHLGLAAALGNLAESWSARFGLAVDYHAVGMGAMRLPPHVEINLYRIAQEALHNVHRHAGPCTVSIVLERADAEVILTVEDDGCGFDGEADAATSPHRLGLISMRERATLMGGRIDIESAAGRGTAIYVRVPLEGGGGGGISVGTASGS